MNKKYICKYCGKEFETGTKLGGHIIRCSKNPKKQEILQNIRSGKRESDIKKFNIKDRSLKCEICGKEYMLKLSDKQFLEGKYKKTCSSKCAHKLTSNNTDKNNKNIKISKSLNNTYDVIKGPKYCEQCGKPIDRKSRFCSVECREIHRKNMLSKSLVGKTGGYRTLSGGKQFKHGRYNNIYFDSSWELAYYIYCIEHNINIERCKEIRYYIYDEKQYKYYPDFIVNGEIIEIKGYITDKVKYKIEQNPDIKVLYYKDIEYCILYCKEKYGDKFWESLYANE